MIDDDSDDDADDGDSHSDKDGIDRAENDSKIDEMMLRDNHSAKNDMDEAEHDCKIDENDDDILLEPIARAASQTAPQVTSVFLMQK